MRSELDVVDHVFRGALNTILLNLELLTPSAEGDEQLRPLLGRISSEVRRLATQVLPAAMHIMQLELGDQRPVDLAQLVAQVRAEHGLEGADEPSAPAVIGDPQLIALALAHLVANAVAATPAGGPAPEVRVDTSDRGAVGLVVQNACVVPAPPLTAEGIPASRGHLGGLVTVMRIARLHRGTLTYERRDKEIVARLSLPSPAKERA